ncbi:MAG: hypothetical protein WCO61_13375, partial [Alphaproteobacteria bacterium]
RSKRGSEDGKKSFALSQVSRVLIAGETKTKSGTTPLSCNAFAISTLSRRPVSVSEREKSGP